MTPIRQRQYELTVDTLTGIMGSIIEHQEQLDIPSILNFVDHYRAYIRNYADVESRKIIPIGFESFIHDQALLNAAAALISIETGEPIVAPDAFYL